MRIFNSKCISPFCEVLKRNTRVHQEPLNNQQSIVHCIYSFSKDDTNTKKEDTSLQTALYHQFHRLCNILSFQSQGHAKTAELQCVNW